MTVEGQELDVKSIRYAIDKHKDLDGLDCDCVAFANAVGVVSVNLPTWLTLGYYTPLMKQGFEVGERRVDVDSAFKNPEHPFRVAIVCAMWLTGFDVECLSTLYIDKSMKAHTLMQAIARANRVYPCKDFGLIVDYNGMLKSLREALAQYALGDDADGAEEIVAPIEERVQALIDALDETEKHLRGLGFEPNRLIGARGFSKIQAIADGVEAVYTPDESKRRFEILARVVFSRFKSLVMEPAAFT
jgi:type I restriction enzyme R subunit